MKIQIDETDFKQLSPAVQRELLERFAGDSGVYRRSRQRDKPVNLDWRRPIDLSLEQAQRLVHGLSEDHRRRLTLFTRKNGRVRMKEILALTEDLDRQSRCRPPLVEESRPRGPLGALAAARRRWLQA